jgi:hypothetical protein
MRPAGTILCAAGQVKHQLLSMSSPTCQVEIRAVRPSAAVIELRRRFENCFVADGADFVFRSPLPDSNDADEQLKWFHGTFQHHRKLLRRLQDQGLNLVVRVRSDRRLPLILSPESLLLAHQLHVPVELLPDTDAG